MAGDEFSRDKLQHYCIPSLFGKNMKIRELEARIYLRNYSIHDSTRITSSTSSWS
jgi:hypothetical protein